jgi:NADH:ubiquinone oxidoreductase subunit F (NADH-binding)
VTSTALTDEGRVFGSRSLPRLLRGLDSDGTAVNLARHLTLWGPTPLPGRGFLDVLDASGVSGHGGAAFPVGAKWRAVHDGGARPVVVANCAEGEPASFKDATLMARSPHLVLDGAAAAASALRATRVVAYVPAWLAPVVRGAVKQRRLRQIDPVEVEVITSPDRFIAGQESAVVNALNGREAIPTFIGLTPVRVRGVNGRPTLVHNVETLAHVALVARFGAQWYRGVGSRQSPGSLLLSVTGRSRTPIVLEAPFGAAAAQVLELSVDTASQYAGALLGGYGGTWVSMATLLELELTEAAARGRGATLGPGVVALLPLSVCPLAEVAAVVRYMHAQSAGQCGPCVHGLAELDTTLQALAFDPGRSGRSVEEIHELCTLVDGRGACRHPDGVARFVRSAVSVFSAEVAAHRRNGACGRVRTPSVLPLGRSRPGSDDQPRRVR